MLVLFLLLSSFLFMYFTEHGKLFLTSIAYGLFGLFLGFIGTGIFYLAFLARFF